MILRVDNFTVCDVVLASQLGAEELVIAAEAVEELAIVRVAALDEVIIRNTALLTRRSKTLICHGSCLLLTLS